MNIWLALYAGLSLIGKLPVLEKGGELGVGINKNKENKCDFKMESTMKGCEGICIVVLKNRRMHVWRQGAYGKSLLSS